MNQWRGVLYQFDRNNQTVKQCMTVDLFPLILANVVDNQREHILLHKPVLNKTPRLSSARMVVRLYRLLLIHCIYVSVTKPTCLALTSSWHSKKACKHCSTQMPTFIFLTSIFFVYNVLLVFKKHCRFINFFTLYDVWNAF